MFSYNISFILASSSILAISLNNLFENLLQLKNFNENIAFLQDTSSAIQILFEYMKNKVQFKQKPRWFHKRFISKKKNNNNQIDYN